MSTEVASRMVNKVCLAAALVLPALGLSAIQTKAQDETGLLPKSLGAPPCSSGPVCGPEAFLFDSHEQSVAHDAILNSQEPNETDAESDVQDREHQEEGEDQLPQERLTL